MPQRSSNQTEKKVISWPSRLPCAIAAVEVVRQDRQHGAEQEFEHQLSAPA